MQATKESMKQVVSHFYPISHLSHLGSGKEEKWDTGIFSSEETASGIYNDTLINLAPTLKTA